MNLSTGKYWPYDAAPFRTPSFPFPPIKLCKLDIIHKVFALHIDLIKYIITVQKWLKKSHFTTHKISNCVQKFNFQKNSKFRIWIFELKSNDFWEFLNGRFTWIILIFAPKIMILFKNRIYKNLKLVNLDNFLAWKFKF